MSTRLSSILDYATSQFDLYHFGLLVILFLCLIFRKTVSPEYRRLFPLLIYWGFSEYMGFVCSVLIGVNGPVYHVYTIVYYLLAVYYYYPQLKKESGMKIYFLLSSSVLVVFTLLNAYFFQPLLVMPTNAIMIHCLFLLALTLFSFKQMLANPIATPIYFQSRFWVSVAILVFNSWSFFFFAAHAYFVQLSNYPLSFYQITRYFSIVLLILMISSFIAEIKSTRYRDESRPI